MNLSMIFMIHRSIKCGVTLNDTSAQAEVSAYCKIYIDVTTPVIYKI